MKKKPMPTMPMHQTKPGAKPKKAGPKPAPKPPARPRGGSSRIQKGGY